MACLQNKPVDLAHQDFGISCNSTHDFTQPRSGWKRSISKTIFRLLQRFPCNTTEVWPLAQLSRTSTILSWRNSTVYLALWYGSLSCRHTDLDFPQLQPSGVWWWKAAHRAAFNTHFASQIPKSYWAFTLWIHRLAKNTWCATRGSRWAHLKHPIDTANAPTHGHTSSTITNKYAAENTVKKLHYRPISPFSLHQFLCFKLRVLARLFTDSLLAVLWFFQRLPSFWPPSPVEAKELCKPDWSSACGSPQISLPL